VAQTDWTAANTIPVLMKSAVDDVISLEYMQQVDHGENSYPLTYGHVLGSSNPTVFYSRIMAPDCADKVVTDNSKVLLHFDESNQF
jgi:hypothetical protein